jgi:hypothetical protein
MIEPKDLDRKQLLGFITDAAKNWLAHDGLWFLEVEKKYGMDVAIEMDGNAWRTFTQIEAQRIMKRLDIEPHGGIPALVQALKFRLYAFLNVQEVVEMSPTRCVFRMNDCRVQAARKRKQLPDFPCKPVGLLEYTHFARTIDPRIETRCVACPPDPHPKDFYCCWEFSIKD